MTEVHADRRVRRTRQALIQAFNELVLSGRKGDIRVSDIVARANVGRSTFYEHYSSADDIRMQALARPLSFLANAVAGQGDPESLRKLLEHFWENRRRARVTFTEKYDQVARLLAGMVEERLSARDDEPLAPLRLSAMLLSEGSLAMIRGWLFAEASSTAETLAATICNTARACLSALYPSGE